MKLQHLAAMLAALWAGMMIGVGYVSAPVIFRMLADERKFAGIIVGDSLTRTTYVTLVLGVLILLLVRAVNRRAGFNTPNAPMILTLGALFLAIVGQFVVHPLVAQARDYGTTALSFGTLHGISSLVYIVEIVCVLALSWSLCKPVKKPDGIESAICDDEDEHEKNDGQEEYSQS